jgi:hypothetical protein
VVSIRDSRPHGQILDPEIPTLLRKLRQPTFVTINYRDFFDRQLLHADYCLACFKLEQQEQDRLPGLLRSVLRLSDYRTKAGRMGKIISWTETGVSHLAI